jgi:chromosome segregation ATPase
MKCNEIEQVQKESTDLRAALKEKSNFNSKENTETKKLMEEIQRLRSLNKNRDEILTEMENKSKNLRETETQLKITQSDIEIL